MILILMKEEGRLNEVDSQKVVTEYGKWSEQIGKNYETGRQLKLDKGVLINKNKELVTDEPFAESKELVGGVVLIYADDMGHATDIAPSCPLINHFDLFVKEVYA